jgi:hypothetical protein
MNAKFKEELLAKEMDDCTFKPKIIKNYHHRDHGDEVVEGHDMRRDRWESLYKIGMQIVSNRKDRRKDDIEAEMYTKECTFKPNLEPSKEMPKISKKIQNDIYNEKSYELLYNRLQNGRIEKLIKDSVHERGDFPQEINDYCKIYY